MSDPEGMMNWLHASHEQARWLAQHGERGEVEFQRGRAAAFREAIEAAQEFLRVVAEGP